MKDKLKPIGKPVEEKPAEVYRYYCEACTGRAFTSTEKTKFVTRSCKSCGNTVSYKEENYILVKGAA